MKPQLEPYWKRETNVLVLGVKIDRVYQFYASNFNHKRHFLRGSVFKWEDGDWCLVWYDAFGARKRFAIEETMRACRQRIERYYDDLVWARKNFENRLLDKAASKLFLGR